MKFSPEQKLYSEIVQKAWDDAEFKKELLANPLEAIEKHTGKKINLPEGKTLIVRDQTDDATVYINIPSKVEIDAELSDEQLEAVAGGAAIWPPKGSGLPPWIVPTLPSESLTT
jgi:hypothetical protein